MYVGEVTRYRFKDRAEMVLDRFMAVSGLFKSKPMKKYMDSLNEAANGR